MKRYLTAVLALTLASASLFAFDFNTMGDIDLANDDDPKVESPLKNKLDKKEKASKTIKAGILLKGTYNEHDINKSEFVSQDYPILIKFYTNEDNNVAYAATYNGNKILGLEIFHIAKEDYPGSADPHAPITVYAVVKFTVKGESKKIEIPVLSAQKLDFMQTPSYENFTYSHGANINADGRCNLCTEKVSDIYHHDCSPADNTRVAKPSAIKDLQKASSLSQKAKCPDCKEKIQSAGQHCAAKGNVSLCGVDYHAVEMGLQDEVIHADDCSDPYHCNCEEKQPAKPAKNNKVPTKTVEVYEKDHQKGCVDKYHCDCPEVKVKRTVPMEKEYVKIHKAGCVDKYHCDCPTKAEYK